MLHPYGFDYDTCINIAEIDMHKYQEYNEYKNFYNSIYNKYSKTNTELLLNQYCFMLKYGEEQCNNPVIKYIINNYPEIISCMDLLNSEKPKYKFIWLFNKKDEYIIQNFFDFFHLEPKIFNIKFEDHEYIIYISNLMIDYDFNKNIFYLGKHDLANKIQIELNKIHFDLAKRMVKYGLYWYIYSNPTINYSGFNKLLHIHDNLLNAENNNWSKVGYRKDLDHVFRSAWEANIARLLNFKNISWKYETEKFILNSPSYYKEDSKFLYIPDFLLEDGTILEIKGFWDNRSKKNVSQFIQQYPNIKYIVIDADIYHCLNKKYKDIIPYWEDSDIGLTNDTIQVVGITLPQRKSFVSKIKVGDILEIVREPSNKYDSMAIRVNDSDKNHIGYFSRECNCIYSPKIDLGFKYNIKVISKEAKVLHCKIKLINTNECIIPDLFL